jgi:hypothetical protein
VATGALLLTGCLGPPNGLYVGCGSVDCGLPGPDVDLGAPSGDTPDMAAVDLKHSED